MIPLLVNVLILILIFGAIFYAVTLIPVQPWKNLALIVVILIFILIMLNLIYPRAIF